MATKMDKFPRKFFNAKMLKDSGPMVLTIENESLEGITDPKSGRTMNKSVLSFEGIETKLILNGINFDLVCEVTGETDTLRWQGHEVELFCDRTTMGADRVDCVRIRPPEQPKLAPKKRAANKDVPPPKGDGMDDEIGF